MPLLASPFGFECLDPFPDKGSGMNATYQKGHIGMAAFAAFFYAKPVVPGPSAAAGASAVIVAS
jgi:hypothetical protein